MSRTIQKLDDQCQRLELRGQQVFTAVETGNLQTASILKALSAKGEASERDSVRTATDGPAVNKEVMRLLISASRASERKEAECCKTLVELFHDSSVNETIPDKEKSNYSAVVSAIAPACWKFVAPHAAGLNKICSNWNLWHVRSPFWRPFDSMTCFGARTTSQKLSEQLIPGRLMSKLPVCPCGCKPVQAYFGSVENQVLVSRHS